MRKEQPKPPHNVTVMWISDESRERVGHGKWRPICLTCGWNGRDQTMKSDADHDADGHAIAMSQVEE